MSRWVEVASGKVVWPSFRDAQALGTSRYGARVIQLEHEGMTTSDAQSVADCELQAKADAVLRNAHSRRGQAERDD